MPKSSSSFNNHLENVPKARATTGIIVTFFISQARSWYLSFLSLSFSFILWSASTGKSKILQVLFFMIFIRSDLRAVIRWFVCMSNPQRSLCVTFSWDRWWVVHITFVRMVKIIISIIHSLELFTSALADAFSLESEWQLVSSSLQDSSEYSGRSQ